MNLVDIENHTQNKEKKTYFWIFIDLVFEKQKVKYHWESWFTSLNTSKSWSSQKLINLIKIKHLIGPRARRIFSTPNHHYASDLQSNMFQKLSIPSKQTQTRLDLSRYYDWLQINPNTITTQLLKKSTFVFLFCAIHLIKQKSVYLFAQ